MNTHYAAPWGRPLKITSVFATLLCLGIAAWSFAGPSSIKWVGYLPLAFALGSALFMVRGFELSKDALRVKRLFWTTRLPLADLATAEWDPAAMRRSIRTLGNGGFYSYTGYYRNKALGSYRAYVTDLDRAVVLRFTDRRLVISPDDPAGFLRELQTLTGKGTAPDGP
ncbi:hypothetical protein BURK2_01606 [Burkholderiales bacterium]|nr:MAG: hypothetical protein F9K47_03335 [Burkholderiales bacterium]CAG0976624.1 hypothetical protein BURK2_01606 [Burkholderiales bacterium]